MGKVHELIDDRLRAWIEAQKMFFVATAPLGGDGHVNVSPKGLDAFRVLAPRRVAYLDIVGSGVETIAHLRENGRITLMFCAFEGSPKIVRLYGRGRVVPREDPAFEEAARDFPVFPAPRAVIVVDVERVADSCGYGVPLYTFEGDRDQLAAWADRKGPEGVEAYVRAKNRTSIDGLAGIDPAE